MTIEEFTKRLAASGCAFVIVNGAVEVTSGNVDLSNLATLPDNTTFSNGGNVDLSGLTTMPDNTTFINGGYVYLSGLTTMPDNTTFSNGGYVYLSGLTSETQTYRGEAIRLRCVDGYTMLILSSRKLGEATVSRARYFGGGDIAKLKACYIASQGGYNAHGDTAEQALRDLRFKVMQEDFDCDELIETIKRRGTVEFNDFRLITGACESGLRHGMTECGLDPDLHEYPLATVLAKAHGSFGAAFKRHFAEAVA